MTAATANNPDLLSAEILDQAWRESEAILLGAKGEAEAILTAARAEAERTRSEQRSQAKAEAARRQELILETVAVEAGRLRAGRVEAILESIHAEIRRQLSAGNFDAHKVVVALAAEAVGHMYGNQFALAVSPADYAAFGHQLAVEIAARVGNGPWRLAVSSDGAVTDGVIVQSPDGQQIWDNRLSARLERGWPDLRREIAAVTSLLEAEPSGGGS